MLITTWLITLQYYDRGLCFNYSRAAQALSDEEQAFMLKDYAHQIIILIIALRQGRYFTI